MEKPVGRQPEILLREDSLDAFNWLHDSHDILRDLLNCSIHVYGYEANGGYAVTALVVIIWLLTRNRRQ